MKFSVELFILTTCLLTVISEFKNFENTRYRVLIFKNDFLAENSKFDRLLQKISKISKKKPEKK